MKHIPTELQQMKTQMLTKKTLLQQKLRQFQTHILKQYSDLCDPITQIIQDFTTANTLKDGFSISEDNQAASNRFHYIKDQFVRWQDKTRRIFSKLQKLECAEDLLGKISQKIVTGHRKLLKSKVSENRMEELKDQFNQICNYKKKTGEEYKYYRCPQFCSYIITQTFKKTFADVSDFLATVGSNLPKKVHITSTYAHMNT